MGKVILPLFYYVFRGKGCTLLRKLRNRGSTVRYEYNSGFNTAAYIDKYRMLRNSKYTKSEIENALINRNMKQIREISRYLYSTSGMYKRAVKYVALAPSYYYTITPYIWKRGVLTTDVALDMDKALRLVDSLDLASQMPKIAVKVVRDGVFYGYFRKNNETALIQELPIDYCRSTFDLNGFAAVEFNLRYFDEQLPNYDTKEIVINTYPEDIKRAYADWKMGNTEGMDTRQGGVWVLLNPQNAIRLSIEEDLSPLFSSAMTGIVDLDDLWAIDKTKAEQQLQKLIYQKVPLDKNGDFIFDMEEAQAMHQNAAAMVSNSKNVDVLTGFSDIELYDMGDTSEPIDGDKWLKNTYSDLGISGQLFATEGNLALEKSVITDEVLMGGFIADFQRWLNYQLKLLFDNDGYDIKIWFPPITQYNKVDMSKTYKDLATLGYSKMLPTIALGQTQLGFINSTVYENSVLNLNEYMTPLASSYTSSTGGSGGKGGRPEKPMSEKSDKTLANQNSQ